MKISDKLKERGTEAPVPGDQPVEVTDLEEHRRSKDTGCHLVQGDVNWNAMSRTAG